MNTNEALLHIAGTTNVVILLDRWFNEADIAEVVSEGVYGADLSPETVNDISLNAGLITAIAFFYLYYTHLNNKKA